MLLLLVLLAAAPAGKQVVLTLESEPPAHAEAFWVGGKGNCDTPCKLRVPRGAHVQVDFTAPGHLRETRNVHAKDDETLHAKLPEHAPF